MDKTGYLRQIDKFYRKQLPANQVVQLGTTPEYLTRLGAEPLPIVIKQSTLAKCIRIPKGSRSAHSLDREMIESLPDQLEHPILAVEEKDRNSYALITDAKDKNGNHMLIALKLKNQVQTITVNEITSFYGRNNLDVYLGIKHDASDIHIIDNKKAKALSSLLRLQLPTTLKAFDYENKLASKRDFVKNDFESNPEVLKQKSLLDKLHNKQLSAEHKETPKKDLSHEHNYKNRI